MDLSTFVQRLRANAADGPGTVDAWHVDAWHVDAWHQVEPQSAKMQPLPKWLHPGLAAALEARGILELFSHQRECADLLHDQKHAVIATSTASGKSLAYHLPVLDALLRDGLDARALYLYPTKALARDQMADLEQLITEVERGEAAAGEARVGRRACINGPQPVSRNSVVMHLGWVA